MTYDRSHNVPNEGCNYSKTLSTKVYYKTRKIRRMNNNLNHLRKCFQPRQWFIGEGEPNPYALSEEDTFMWVYRSLDATEQEIFGGKYCVGYFMPDKTWQPDMVYQTREEASARVNYLNGGK